MRTLQRTLGLRDLVFIVVGVVIGSGIFVVPSTVLQQVGGNVNIALTVWLVAGVLSLLGALTFGELGAMQPEAGGLYVFLREAFGPLVGFLFGWTLFFVMGSGSIATLAEAFAGYLSQLMPLSPASSRAASIAMIVVAMSINIAGTRRSSRVQTWTTSFKVLAILAMSALLLIGGSGGSAAAPATAGTASLLSGIGLAMIGVLWAYEGWQYATFLAGETRDPQRTFPRGMAIGTAALVVIYCLANVAYIAALGPAGVMETQGVAAAAVGEILGAGAAKLIALAILVAIFSAANAVVLTASRVFYAMASDGVFFRRLAVVHPTTGTPVFAIASCCLWAMVLSATGTFDQLLTYVVFTGWLFYALGAAAVFVYRRRDPDAHRPFRVPGYPVTPLLFVLSAAAIVINTLIGTPARAAIGLAVVLAGAPAYFIWRTRKLRMTPVSSAIAKPGEASSARPPQRGE
jgi:APA family basic amino acid/polyamine antiporter